MSVNRDVGLGSHSLSYSSPVLNKPLYGFCGLKASRKKEERQAPTRNMQQGRPPQSEQIGGEPASAKHAVYVLLQPALSIEKVQRTNGCVRSMLLYVHSDRTGCQRRPGRPFYRAGFTESLQDMLFLALPCILIIFLKVVSFCKFPSRY